MSTKRGKASKVRRRLFICDPACVQEIGHNLHALISFRKAFESVFDNIIPVATLSLSENVANTSQVTRHYRFYYPEYFPNVNDELNRKETSIGYDKNFPIIADKLEIIATEDAFSLISKFDMSSDDCILFPHLDFYGVVGVLNALSSLPAERRPQLALRFIGVMENATAHYTIPSNELLLRIRVALSNGLKIIVSAETARYAHSLANVLETMVPVTGYPLVPQFMPMRDDGAFYFYCPGSARADKGFFELQRIFSEVRIRDSNCHIRFVSQNLPDKEAHNHLGYIRQLSAIPGVQLQPGAVTSQQMVETYKKTHAILLPYARDVYEYRGSAVLMEAASYGRPVIAYDKTGFSSSIEYYGLGKNVSCQQEMINSIIEMAAVDRYSLTTSAQQGGYRFHRDNVTSFNGWLNGDA